ncbi:metal-dependent hydrolase [Erysipelothrix urinaevulpis]|uniref:metal-dependent hydrolase n=1 Tax=Erysipelothrix urinaevulpis TaxID=2683717 RepID=UPI001359E340|nr:metal-dependent hydrolase [Erysipelothrix urinaevulpis]
MILSWHGHSCVQIHCANGESILIDPFITDNPDSDLNLNELNPDYIVLTHAHNDHFGDTLEIAKKSNALVIAMVELADFIELHDLRTHGMNIGGSYKFSFGNLKFVPALHSSSLTINNQTLAMGLAAGLVFEIEGKRIYHAGDTAFYSDMKELAPIDLAFVPIGDNFTMGIDDAVKASQTIQAKNVVPIHYNTFPVIQQNPQTFIDRLDPGQGLLVNAGDKIEY